MTSVLLSILLFMISILTIYSVVMVGRLRSFNSQVMNLLSELKNQLDGIYDDFSNEEELKRRVSDIEGRLVSEIELVKQKYTI